MATTTAFIMLVIFVAFIFDFINGFHDAANSIATIVTTKVLTPKQAVLWAAFFNFIAFLIFNLSVATIIGTGLITPSIVDPGLVLSALIGAIFWNLLTWYYGLPSSSSHALVGGLAGAAIAKAGFSSLQVSGFITVFSGIFIAPIVALLLGFITMKIFQRYTQHVPPEKVTRTFKLAQLGSSALLSLTHGGNDAQKTMGIIASLLFSASWLEGAFYVPFWVIISCQAVISLGTLVGGWRIVHTMGKQITHLTPLRGSAAETSAAIMIFAATQCGLPVSTTHTVTGAITGVGLSSSLKQTPWPILSKIFSSWILTVPAAGLVAAAIEMLIRYAS